MNLGKPSYEIDDFQCLLLDEDGKELRDDTPVSYGEVKDLFQQLTKLLRNDLDDLTAIAIRR